MYTSLSLSYISIDVYISLPPPPLSLSLSFVLATAETTKTRKRRGCESGGGGREGSSDYSYLNHRTRLLCLSASFGATSRVLFYFEMHSQSLFVPSGIFVILYSLLSSIFYDFECRSFSVGVVVIHDLMIDWIEGWWRERYRLDRRVVERERQRERQRHRER